MEISITFRDGPIEAEITANEEDDYEEVLEALSEFVDGYDPNTSGASTNLEADSSETDEEERESEGTTRSSDIGNITDLNDIPEDKLYRIVKVGRVENGEISEHPRIIGDTSLLGESEEERVLNASIVLLAVLDDFHSTDTMKTSELKQAIADSGLDDDDFSNIDSLDEEDVYLNRRGRGPTATTQIRPPGKDEAYKLISELASEQ